MARGPLAGASGPGKFSSRTDSGVGTPELKMGSIAYGEGKATQEIKSGAPLAKTPDTPVTPVTRAVPQVTPLYAPTERPETPVTDGVDVGAGLGSDALSLQKPDDTNFRANIQAYKPVLAFIADQPATSPETKAAIRQLWDM